MALVPEVLCGCAATGNHIRRKFGVISVNRPISGKPLCRPNYKPTTKVPSVPISISYLKNDSPQSCHILKKIDEIPEIFPKVQTSSQMFSNLPCKLHNLLPIYGIHKDELELDPSSSSFFCFAFASSECTITSTVLKTPNVS